MHAMCTKAGSARGSEGPVHERFAPVELLPLIVALLGGTWDRIYAIDPTLLNFLHS